MASSDVIRLRILGAPGLDAADRDTASVLSQPKRLALLAFLAMRRGWVRREHLAEMFWPELEAAAGRRALSQALHFLRRSLGRDALRARGVEEVRLSKDVVDCDVDRFGEAIGDRRWQAALAVYRGALLEGMSIEPSPAFSHWLESERTRLEHLACEAAAKQAKLCFEAGDTRSAVRFQARAVEIRPFDEAMLREYLMLLDEIGDGATALAAYESFRTRLSAGFGLEPSRDTVRVVRMIRSRRPETGPGLPSIGEAVSVRSSGEGPAEPAGPGSEAVRMTARAGRTRPWSEMKTKHWRRRFTYGGVAIFSALLATTAPIKSGSGDVNGETANYPPNRVAVMYFDVGGDTTDVAQIADFLTDALIHSLRSVDTLQVVSTNGVRRFRRLDPPIDTIVNALHVGTILTGRIVKFDSTMTIFVESSDASGKTTSIGDPIQYTAVDVTAMVDSVTWLVSENLRKKIGDDIEMRRWRLSENAEAGIAYARALSVDREFDPSMALGTAIVQSRVAQAIDQIDDAVRLDPHWIEPHLLRAQLSWDMSFYCRGVVRDCDRSAGTWLDDARVSANHALAMEPGNSQALELLGRIEYYSWVFGFAADAAVLEQADGYLQDAVTANARNAQAWKTLSAVRYEQNDLTGAYSAARQALQMDEFLRERPEILWRMFESAFELGRDVEASQACRDIAATASDKWEKWQAGMCDLQLQAWSNERRVDLDSALMIVEPYLAKTDDVTQQNGPITGMGYAAVLARAGEPEQAKDMISRMRHEAMGENSLGMEAALYEAAAWARLGDVDKAVDLAAAYLRANPLARRNTITRRWFRGEIAKRLSDAVLMADDAPQPSTDR